MFMEPFKEDTCALESDLEGPTSPPTKQASFFQWNFALNLKDANKYLASGLRLDSCPCNVYGYTNLRHVSFFYRHDILTV